MDNELVSVIMSTYNEPIDYLKKSVDSIIKQTYRNIEFIIIIDNPDNYELASIISQYKEIDKRIIIIKNDKNLGLVESLNKGLSIAKGKYIARMDADDISDEKRIQMQIEFLKKNKYDLVSSNYILFFSETNDKQNIVFPEKFEDCKKRLKHTNCLPHPCWLGYKYVFEDMKGYRNIKTCEDYDFVIRSVCAGYKIGNCQQFLLNYRFNSKSISRTNEAFQFLITKYIANSYKKNQFIDLYDYDKFVKSNKFILEKEKIDNMLETKYQFKQTKIKPKKIFYFLKLISNYYFWKMKLISVL